MNKKIGEIGRFSVVGIINTAIDLLVFYIVLYHFEFNLIVANTIAYSVATINSYLMNKYWTFADQGTTTVTRNEVSRFLIFNLSGLALSNLAIYSLAGFIQPITAKVGAIGATFIWNYFTVRYFVFRKH